MIADTLGNNPRNRYLIIDTKPRFRAERLFTGTTARPHYRNWRAGDMIQDSYRLPLGATLTQQHWELARRGTPGNRGTCIIAQTNDEDYFPWLNEVMYTFYQQASKRYDEYIYLDEMLQFFGGRPTLQKACKQIICSGGELGVQFLGSSQRPKEIPNACMSEMTKCFLFKMDYTEDQSKLSKMGVPPEFRAPTRLHTFAYFDKWTDTLRHELKLALAA